MHSESACACGGDDILTNEVKIALIIKTKKEGWLALPKDLFIYPVGERRGKSYRVEEVIWKEVADIFMQRAETFVQLLE